MRTECPRRRFVLPHLAEGWATQLLASSRCSPSSLPLPSSRRCSGSTARACGGRGSRADAAAFPPLPLAQQQAPSLPCTGAGLGRGGGPRKRLQEGGKLGKRTGKLEGKGGTRSQAAWLKKLHQLQPSQHTPQNAQAHKTATDLTHGVRPGSPEQGLRAHLLALSSGRDSQFPRLPLLLATATLNTSPPSPGDLGTPGCVQGREAPRPSAHCARQLRSGAENNQNDFGLLGET